MNTDVIVKSKSFLQFSKFFVVGILNTGLDFAILNFLMRMTNIYEGQSIVYFNTISFSIAVINSYLLNKYWTFSAQDAVPVSGMGPASGWGEKNKNSSKISTEFIKFFSVSAVGWGLNTGIVYSVTTLISPIFGLGPALWANAAKLLATGAVLAWNFAGYKLFVFKK